MLVGKKRLVPEVEHCCFEVAKFLENDMIYLYMNIANFSLKKIKK